MASCGIPPVFAGPMFCCLAESVGIWMHEAKGWKNTRNYDLSTYASVGPSPFFPFKGYCLCSGAQRKPKFKLRIRTGIAGDFLPSINLDPRPSLFSGLSAHHQSWATYPQIRVLSRMVLEGRRVSWRPPLGL